MHNRSAGCGVAKRSAFSWREEAERVLSVTVHLTALRISPTSECVSGCCEGISCNANPSRPVHFAWAINHEPHQIVIYNHRMSGILLHLLLLIHRPHSATFSLSFNHRVSTDGDRGGDSEVVARSIMDKRDANRFVSNFYYVGLSLYSSS